MKPSRRAFIAIGFAGLAALGWPLFRKGFNSFGRAVLRRSFGDEIAARPDTAAFIDDFRDRFMDRKLLPFVHQVYFDYGIYALDGDSARLAALEQSIVRSFLQSTNFIEHLEGGAAFSYAGLFDPYEQTCQNFLSANGLGNAS